MYSFISTHLIMPHNTVQLLEVLVNAVTLHNSFSYIYMLNVCVWVYVRVSISLNH